MTPDRKILRPPDRPRINAVTTRFPLEHPFKIARGSKTDADVITVEITEGTRRGRGECVPYARYGETVEGVLETIHRLAPDLETGVMNRRNLQRHVPPGAARNAIDCALWDFDAKRSGSAVWQMVGLDMPRRLVTAYTIVLDTAEAMAKNAADHNYRPLLKLKLGTDDDLPRLAAVRAAAPRARLIIDANEGWTLDQWEAYQPALKAAAVELVEQPLPAGADAGLAEVRRLVPICADESCHTVEDLERIAPLYDAINIKLDKTGGLTAALALSDAAHDLGKKIMVGCLVGSSLSIAPAILLAQTAHWVDLDAPLLLARDRQPGLRYDGSMLYPPNTSLWG